MIAMQYQFILPTDYPMDSIKKRIHEKGHLLDGFSGLLFKAYLYSEKNDKDYNSHINSYAPFYIWKDTSAMANFLQSAGFNALCEQFGRPKVQTWLVTPPSNPPGKEMTFACISNADEVKGHVSGFSCESWQAINVQWLPSVTLAPKKAEQYYRIGYVAYGE